MGLFCVFSNFGIFEVFRIGWGGVFYLVVDVDVYVTFK